MRLYQESDLATRSFVLVEISRTTLALTLQCRGEILHRCERAII
jgi:hypothetical protein